MTSRRRDRELAEDATAPSSLNGDTSAMLSFSSSLKSTNWPLDIFSTALPGIGGKADANTNGAVVGARATPSSSASQAGEGSGREEAGRSVERPEPDPPAEGMTPGSGAAMSNAPEWAAEIPTKGGKEECNDCGSTPPTSHVPLRRGK